MGCRVTGYSQNENGVTLVSDQRDFSGDLLIGADGINSAVRDQMHGETPVCFTGQLAWRGTLSTAAVPDGSLVPGEPTSPTHPPVAT
ncbi:MAG: hypothetical protein M2R45_04931 [Verrucomicrobia subdivision 3 bacterium]|nr:hypothetical protein [Limisphaerales bacterium]